MIDRMSLIVPRERRIETAGSARGILSADHSPHYLGIETVGALAAKIGMPRGRLGPQHTLIETSFEEDRLHHHGVLKASDFVTLRELARKIDGDLGALATHATMPERIVRLRKRPQPDETLALTHTTFEQGLDRMQAGAAREITYYHFAWDVFDYVGVHPLVPVHEWTHAVDYTKVPARFRLPIARIDPTEPLSAVFAKVYSNWISDEAMAFGVMLHFHERYLKSTGIDLLDQRVCPIPIDRKQLRILGRIYHKKSGGGLLGLKDYIATNTAYKDYKISALLFALLVKAGWRDYPDLQKLTEAISALINSIPKDKERRKKNQPAVLPISNTQRFTQYQQIRSSTEAIQQFPRDFVPSWTLLRKLYLRDSLGVAKLTAYFSDELSPADRQIFLDHEIDDLIDTLSRLSEGESLPHTNLSIDDPSLSTVTSNEKLARFLKIHFEYELPDQNVFLIFVNYVGLLGQSDIITSVWFKLLEHMRDKTRK